MNAQAPAVDGMTRGRRIVAALAVVGALLFSVVLLVTSIKHGTMASLPGCGGAESALDCEHVLRSRWSSWLSMPVSGLASMLYVTMLAGLLHAGPDEPWRLRRLALSVLHIAAVAVVGAAAWFIGLQVNDGKYCLYCMSAHSLGVMAALVILTRPGAHRGASWALTVAGLMGVATLVGGQLATPPATMRVKQLGGAAVDFDQGRGAERQISILGGRVALRPAQFPVLGSVDAPNLLVYLFDYTCPYCRLLHNELEQVREEFKQTMSIVLLPVPMNPGCNSTVKTPQAQHEHACELAKLAMALWRARPEVWPQFDHWLMQGEHPPTPGQAREQALTLIDAAALDAALADPWISQQIERNVKLHELSSAGVVPTIIVKHVMLLARPTRAELLKVLDQELGIRPPG
jgi:uncharacterized membrane protein/protein-disulfide isomerase